MHVLVEFLDNNVRMWQSNSAGKEALPSTRQQLTD